MTGDYTTTICSLLLGAMGLGALFGVLLGRGPKRVAPAVVVVQDPGRTSAGCGTFILLLMLLLMGGALFIILIGLAGTVLASSP